MDFLMDLCCKMTELDEFSRTQVYIPCYKFSITDPDIRCRENYNQFECCYKIGETLASKDFTE